MPECIPGYIVYMAKSRPLANLHILVTRPAQRASAFADSIAEAGGEAVLYPVIDICAPRDTRSRDTALHNLADFNMAIFISPTAVEETLAMIPALPDSLSLVAIGSSTARALKQFGYSPAFEANTSNSETLLLQDQMQSSQVRNLNIIIFRGEGGRELLADTLRQRGAQVEYADMYRRDLPQQAHLQTAQLDTFDAVCVTSNQGLEHLMLLCDDPVALKQLALFVPGQRGAALARDLGFSKIHIAEDATDRAMLRALVHWATTTHA